MRFFLGAFEAGVFPGMIFYLSFWYKPEERATRIAVFLCSATLAGAFGGAIAYAVGHLNGAHGLEGWRWLFIVEGVPSSESHRKIKRSPLTFQVALGFFAMAFMPSYPEKASWLDEEEKRLQIARLGVNSSQGYGTSLHL